MPRIEGRLEGMSGIWSKTHKALEWVMDKELDSGESVLSRECLECGATDFFPFWRRDMGGAEVITHTRDTRKHLPLRRSL